MKLVLLIANEKEDYLFVFANVLYRALCNNPAKTGFFDYLKTGIFFKGLER
jgi:hypothetical protein